MKQSLLNITMKLQEISITFPIVLHNNNICTIIHDYFTASILFFQWWRIFNQVWDTNTKTSSKHFNQFLFKNPTIILTCSPQDLQTWYFPRLFLWPTLLRTTKKFLRCSREWNVCVKQARVTAHSQTVVILGGSNLFFGNIVRVDFSRK